MRFRDVPLTRNDVHIASGMPGSGKTALVFNIVDRNHEETEREVYFCLTEDDRPIEDYNVPDYMHSLRGFDYPTDSIIVVDDVHRIAHARRFNSNINVFLDILHANVRHDDNLYVYDTQSLREADVAFVLRSGYRWYKHQYELESEMGRNAVLVEVETADNALIDKGYTYAYLYYQFIKEGKKYTWNGLVNGIHLPEYWTEELSTLHRRRPKPPDLLGATARGGRMIFHGLGTEILKKRKT